MRIPVAYFRKSRVIDDRASVSWEVQEARVRELAATYGDNHGRLLVLSDWNVSGRKGAAQRPGFKKLVEMIQADEVLAVYSYNLARLSRSVQDLRALMALADKHGTAVRLVADHIDTSTATGRMTLTVLAAVDEMIADLASEQARDGVAIRRARGDQIGPGVYGTKPGEDPEAVVRAYQEAGGIAPAVRLLNDRKVPTRSGKSWGTSSVHDVLLRMGAMPRVTRKGAKASAPFVLYRLLHCHCGRVMTGSRSYHGSPGGYVSYKCRLARTVSSHGIGAVPERRILPWIMAEAARLTVPEAVVVEQERQVERERIEARKVRIADIYEASGDRDDYLRRLAALKTLEDALAAKEATESILAVPEVIDWVNWAPEDINKVLAARWERVDLNANMEPVKAAWRVGPEWLDAAPTRKERIADLPAAQREAILAKVAASRHAKKR